MSTKKDGATICRDPVMTARAIVARSMPRLYCPTCEEYVDALQGLLTIAEVGG